MKLWNCLPVFTALSQTKDVTVSFKKLWEPLVVLTTVQLNWSIIAKVTTRNTSTTLGRPHLCCADSLYFNIPRMWTRMGDHALSVAGPRPWNALPADIRCAPSLFSAAYEL